VVDSEGNRVGIFQIAEGVANMAWGGPERKTLYLTANTSVYSLETVVAGAR
jgi:gluconolactonase